MFSLKYEDWKCVCSHILAQPHGRKKMYLQWYPFTNLSHEEKKLLLSETYFNDFINSGIFLYYLETWQISNNYILKSDGNFRNASLVSPILYLILLTIGKNISKLYLTERTDKIHIYYSGNFDQDRYFYKQDYNIFYKLVNKLSQDYHFFLKTDIKDFFSNININILFDRINKNVNKENIQISQKDLMIYKEFLMILGQGEYPLIENSLTSSYLSTVIYLEEADINLNNYLLNKADSITGFVMLRYVDDLYILFNSNTSLNNLKPIINRIINYYSSELKRYNLSLNRTKTVLKKITELNGELKKSFYNEYFNGTNFKISDIIDNKILINFLDDIEYALTNDNLDVNKYLEIIEDVFNMPDVEYTAHEVFSSLVYRNHALFYNKTFISKFMSFIELDYNFLKIDAKRLVIILLNTRDQTLIKAFLNKLFLAHRDEKWDTYDTSLAINYLLQRRFEHKDLLKILEKEENNVYLFYRYFCSQSFIKTYIQSKDNYIQIFNDKMFYKNDEKLFLLYYFSQAELKKNNYLSSFAYFKNFFDRMSAHLASYINKDGFNGKPNYKAYYKEGSFRRLYSDIKNFDIIIKKAHEIRNSNPISHSSAELIDRNSSQDVLQSISDLLYLIKNKIIKMNDDDKNIINKEVP